jgi:hypothetical protein
MPTTVRSLAGGCGAIALMAMTGCSVEGGGETKTVTVEQPSSGGEASAPSPSPSPSPSAPSPSPEGALGQAEGTVDGVRVRFVISELRRRGPTVILNARVEALKPEGGVAGQINMTFSDGESQEGAAEADLFDGPALIDPQARKKYLVVRDSEGRCLCTNSLASAFLDEDPVDLEATLTAPPAGVDRVDVLVPHIKTFADVPISG